MRKGQDRSLPRVELGSGTRERKRTDGCECERSSGDDAKTDELSPSCGVVDLFCGAGGLTYGLIKEGLQVVAGVDTDEQCRYPYEYNTGARFLNLDVGRMSADSLRRLFGNVDLKILVGCAPCQPFSVYNQKNNDAQWKLVDRFAELIRAVKPDIVSMENVPRLKNYRDGSVFIQFLASLKEVGYQVTHDVVDLVEYGLPQQRSRLVVMASLHGRIVLEPPNESQTRCCTVENAIGKLRPIVAGEVDQDDRLHRASRLSKLNLKRIRASMPGGSWDDWESDLRAECHRVQTGKGYKSVYGRMRFDEPAPTITTQFYGFGNGRFGHPEQDRAISLREGAILQSFPDDYEFVQPENKIQFKVLGRMIGNAVPIVLARAIGRSIRQHIREIKPH